VIAAGRAVRLDPLDPEARSNLGLAHLATGNADLAVVEARRALEPHPEFSYAIWVMALGLFNAGRPDEGCVRLRTMRERQFLTWATMALGIQQSRSGDRTGVTATVAELERAGAHFKAGILHAECGDPDAAFSAMRRATPLVWDDALFLRYLRADPLAGLRADTRLQALLADLDASWGLRG
jgi:tetratricopeptide (TPR) repeat protein